MSNADDEKGIEKKTLDTLSENLARLFREHHTNESELAKKLNITYNTIHRLVSGTTSDPKLSTLQQIADYFKIGIDSLLSNNQTKPQDKEGKCFIPILNWDNLPIIYDASTFKPETCTKWISVATNENKAINQYCYALDSTKSMQPRFPLGTTFIINPSETPIDGDLVLVKFKDEKSISLRELVIDSPDWQLYPIIPGSKSLVLNRNKVHIIGTVILTLIQNRI